MKRIVNIAVYLLAVIGALLLCYHTLAYVSHRISPGYPEDLRRDIGNPEAIKDLSELYQRIEKSPHDPALKTPGLELLPQSPIIRNIPKEWLSPKLSQLWRPSYPVFALYDEKDNFVGIDFHGMRRGVLITKSGERCPIHFQTLDRITEYPIYISGYIPGVWKTEAELKSSYSP